MTDFGITPLMQACQNNSLEEIKAILAKGTKINELDSQGRTALHYCAEHTDTKCAELLIQNKINVNHQDREGYSCLHLAIINGNMKLVQLLSSKAGANLNLSDSEQHSPVHWAVVCGHPDILDFLLNKNADPETADVHGAYPIHYASQMCGQVDLWDETIMRDQTKSLLVLKKLIKHKVKVDVEDSDQRNAFIWAASSGSIEAMTELYKAGSDPNKHEKDGLTALHCAASRNHTECIKALVNNCKADVDVMDNNNCTPIFYAATLGHLEACNLLIKYDANLHVQDCKGRTVYHCAAAKGQLKCLKALCKKNSNIWLRNRRGDFPVHEAYYNKQTECLYFLLDAISGKRASKAANMYDGRTLLHLAAADNDLKLCKRLIADGLDPNGLMKTSSKTYMTPYDIAVLKKSDDVAKYLKSVGGETGTERTNKIRQTAKDSSKSSEETEEDMYLNSNLDDSEIEEKKKSKEMAAVAAATSAKKKRKDNKDTSPSSEEQKPPVDEKKSGEKKADKKDKAETKKSEKKSEKKVDQKTESKKEPETEKKIVEHKVEEKTEHKVVETTTTTTTTTTNSETAAGVAVKGAAGAVVAAAAVVATSKNEKDKAKNKKKTVAVDKNEGESKDEKVKPDEKQEPVQAKQESEGANSKANKEDNTEQKKPPVEKKDSKGENKQGASSDINSKNPTKTKKENNKNTTTKVVENDTVVEEQVKETIVVVDKESETTTTTTAIVGPTATKAAIASAKKSKSEERRERRERKEDKSLPPVRGAARDGLENTTTTTASNSKSKSAKNDSRLKQPSQQKIEPVEGLAPVKKREKSSDRLGVTSKNNNQAESVTKTSQVVKEKSTVNNTSRKSGKTATTTALPVIVKQEKDDAENSKKNKNSSSKNPDSQTKTETRREIKPVESKRETKAEPIVKKENKQVAEPNNETKAKKPKEKKTKNEEDTTKVARASAVFSDSKKVNHIYSENNSDNDSVVSVNEDDDEDAKSDVVFVKKKKKTEREKSKDLNAQNESKTEPKKSEYQQPVTHKKPSQLKKRKEQNKIDNGARERSKSDQTGGTMTVVAVTDLNDSKRRSKEEPVRRDKDLNNSNTTSKKKTVKLTSKNHEFAEYNDHDDEDELIDAEHLAKQQRSKSKTRDKAATTTSRKREYRHLNDEGSDTSAQNYEEMPEKERRGDQNPKISRYFYRPNNDHRLPPAVRQTNNNNQVNTRGFDFTTDDSAMRLIVKSDGVKSASLTRGRYANLFDRQRLVLKSLYEIRRCRINNRDIVVSADLNNMLMRYYDYDVKRSCRGIKDLERVLESIAIEISDEYKKSNKKSKTLLGFKSRSQNFSRSDNAMNNNETARNPPNNTSFRSEENEAVQSIEFKNPNNELNDADFYRMKSDRQQMQYDQLRIAYKPLLPNDIYNQYYGSMGKSKSMLNPSSKEQTPRERTVLLPVINQKPHFQY